MTKHFFLALKITLGNKHADMLPPWLSTWLPVREACFESIVHYLMFYSAHLISKGVIAGSQFCVEYRGLIGS